MRLCWYLADGNQVPRPKIREKDNYYWIIPKPKHAAQHAEGNNRSLSEVVVDSAILARALDVLTFDQPDVKNKIGKLKNGWLKFENVNLINSKFKNEN